MGPFVPNQCFGESLNFRGRFKAFEVIPPPMAQTSTFVPIFLRINNKQTPYKTLLRWKCRRIR